MIFSLFSQMRPGPICQNQRAEQICPRWKRPGKAPPGRNFPGFFRNRPFSEILVRDQNEVFPARGIARHLADWTRASRFQKYFLARTSMRCVETCFCTAIGRPGLCWLSHQIGTLTYRQLA